MASNRIVVAKPFDFNEHNPWDRVQGESARAFRAFTVYRDLGAERSVKAVSIVLKKHPQVLYRWNAHYSWNQRAQAWDEFQDQLGQRETIRQRIEFHKSSLLVAQKMTSKALSGILALQTTKLIKRRRNGGKPVEEEVLAITPSDLVRIFECAHKVQKDVLGKVAEDNRVNFQVEFLPTPDDDEPEQSPARPEDGEEAT